MRDVADSRSRPTALWLELEYVDPQTRLAELSRPLPFEIALKYSAQQGARIVTAPALNSWVDEKAPCGAANGERLSCRSVYQCADCGFAWMGPWAAACNDHCPRCGRVVAPMLSLPMRKM